VKVGPSIIAQKDESGFPKDEDVLMALGKLIQAPT
jgi:hypothetical protein